MSVFPLVPLCHRQLCPRDGYVCLSVGSLMCPSALPRGWFPHVFVSFAQGMVMSVFPLVPLCLRQLCPGDGSLMSPSALPRGWFPHVFVSFAQGMVMSVFMLVPSCHRQLCPRDGYVCLSVGSLMSPSALPKGWLCLSFRWFPYVTVSFAQGMVMSVFPLVPLCHLQLCPRDGYVCLSVGSLMSPSALPKGWLYLSFRWFPYVTVSFAQEMVMSVFPLVPLCHRQLCPGMVMSVSPLVPLCHRQLCPRDGYVCLSVGSLMSPSALPKGWLYLSFRWFPYVIVSFAQWLCLSFRWFPYVTVSFAQEMVMSVFPLVPLCHRQLCPRDGYVCLSVGSLMFPSALPRGWFPHVFVSFAQGMVMSVFPLVPLCHLQLCPRDGYVCLSVGFLMSPSALPKGWLCLSFRWFPYITVSFAQGMVMSVCPLVPSCHRQLYPGDGCLSFRWFLYVTVSFAQGMVISVFPLVPLCHRQLYPRDGYVCLSVGSLMSPSALPKGWLCLSFRWFPYVTFSFAQGMVMSVFPLVPLCHRQLCPRDGYVCLSVGSIMSTSALPRRWLFMSFRWFPCVTFSFAQGMVISVFPLVSLCHRQLCPRDGYVCLSVGSLMSPSALPKGWLCLSFRYSLMFPSALPRGWFPHVFVSFAQEMVMFVFPLVPSCHRQLCPRDGYVCLSVGSLMSPSALPKGWLCLSFRWFPYVTVSFAQEMVMSVFPFFFLMSPSALPKGWLCVSFRWFPHVSVSFAQGMVPSCLRQLCPGDGYVCLYVGSLMSPSALPR